MDYRGIVLTVAVLGAGISGVAVSTTACSAPDPGTLVFSARVHPGDAPTSSGGTPTGDGGGGTSSGTPSPDGGSSGTVTPDAVFGTDAFIAGQPGSQDSTAGSGHMGAGSPGATGVDCTTCHKTGGAAAANIWTAAGTVYTTSAGTTPVGEGVEVRIVDSTGKKLGVSYTDKSGNFAFNAAALPSIPTGANAGVRDGTHKPSDMGAANGVAGGCNGTACHGSAQRMYLGAAM